MAWLPIAASPTHTCSVRLHIKQLVLTCHYYHDDLGVELAQFYVFIRIHIVHLMGFITHCHIFEQVILFAIFDIKNMILCYVLWLKSSNICITQH